ncbi:AfsR/SARP family transcriptional regulator [Saccharothrix sp. ST-888]|uniref:AfsR/SARP family transcriptional regulator n=1 Tax=Saccharothrix sp. ST-888 TaxID=1427391 RepID=UPI0006966626|nr:BTAD domain-containing putative transcriptional regulator [Saccharothrix sp. ST-888]
MFPDPHEIAKSFRFALLGPIRAWRGSREVDLGSARQRAVLARLLLATGQPHAISEIIEAVWGEELPGNPRNLVHKYVGGLRRALDPDVGDARTSELLPLIDNGYSLLVDRDQVDLNVFTQTVAEGVALVDIDLDTARERLDTALGLWRGDAFGPLSTEFFGAERSRLVERRLSALEDRIGIDIALGRHAEAAVELVSLLVENPLREHLAVLLMIAFYRSGRQADALRVFQDCRRKLTTELGIEPARELQEIQLQILAGDPIRTITLSCGRTVTATAPNSRSGRHAGPNAGKANGRPSTGGAERCHLKPDLSDFVARERELTQVCTILVEPAQVPPTVVITGNAGMGKSALAVRVANLVKSRFLGGQFQIDLRGMSADPVTPQQALQRLLRMLGVEEPDETLTPDELGELYRSVLGDDVLTVFDDVSDERQVRPLLGASATIITSRRRLTGLEGAHIVELDAMSADDAVRMLDQIIGPERLSTDPAQAARIGEFTDGSPLALRIAGARLLARPHWSLRQFADRLADEDRRLVELTHNDLDIRASLATTFHWLNPQSVEAFLLLGSWDERSFTIADATGPLGLSEIDAADVIEELVDVRLVDARRTDGTGEVRYQLRDLVRRFARSEAEGSAAPPATRLPNRRVLEVINLSRHGGSARRAGPEC